MNFILVSCGGRHLHNFLLLVFGCPCSLYIYIYIYISMRCAPTPPQCPLPSILIAVCVPMSSHCEFYGMCAQHLVAFVRGNYVMFCLLLLPHGPPNPCQILPKMVPNRRGGTPWRALSAPKRPKGTQERSKRPPETAKKRLQERLGALLRRFGRVLSAIGASRRSLLDGILSPK